MEWMWCVGNVETARWNCTANLTAARTHRTQRTKRHHLKTWTHLPIVLSASFYVCFLFLFCLLSTFVWFHQQCCLCLMQLRVPRAYWVPLALHSCSIATAFLPPGTCLHHVRRTVLHKIICASSLCKSVDFYLWKNC